MQLVRVAPSSQNQGGFRGGIVRVASGAASVARRPGVKKVAKRAGINLGRAIFPVAIGAGTHRVVIPLMKKVGIVDPLAQGVTVGVTGILVAGFDNPLIRGASSSLIAVGSFMSSVAIG